MAHAELIEVLVAWATPAGQQVVPLEVRAGTTAAQAVAMVPGAPAMRALGVWGEVVPPDRVLAAGDRVELYEGLAADPKDQRRQRALRRR